MIIRSTLLLLALVPTAVGAADIYQCVDANGRAVFVDRPCSPSPASDSAPPAGESASSGQPSAKARWSHLRADFEGALAEDDLRKTCILLGQVVRLAGEVGEAQRAGVRAWKFVDLGIGPGEIVDIEEQSVRVGMSPCAVYAAWGNPFGGIRKGGVTEQWVYEGPDGNVYFRDGKTTAIDGPRGATEARARSVDARRPSVRVISR